MSDIVERAEEALAAEWVNPESPTALCYIASELVVELKAVRAEAERLHSWDGLLSLLDEHYPEDIFPTLEDLPDRDPGPRIISLLRQIHRIRGESA